MGNRKNGVNFCFIEQTPFLVSFYKHKNYGKVKTCSTPFRTLKYIYKFEEKLGLYWSSSSVYVELLFQTE